jgi:hydrogenase maturation protease
MQHYLIGLGNYSMGDDSIGLRVVEYVESKGMARGFEPIEAGNNGMLVLSCFREDVGKVVIVDCARMGLERGEPGWIAPEDAESQKIVGGLSTHEGDMLKLLALARQLGLPIPTLRILGIEPESVAMGTELSATLARRLPEYAAMAVQELSG